MPVTNTEISVAWLAEHVSRAESEQNRVWRSLASREDWGAWLDQHIRGADLFTVVYYEDRAKERMVVQGDTLSYYVPMTHVQAALEARTLPDFMAEIYRDVFRKWAQKRKLPDPPPIGNAATDSSRLP